MWSWLIILLAEAASVKHDDQLSKSFFWSSDFVITENFFEPKTVSALGESGAELAYVLLKNRDQMEKDPRDSLLFYIVV